MSKAPSDRKQAGGFATPISINTEKAQAKLDTAKRVAIFELDGVVYDMPGAPRADVALTYLDTLNNEGEESASYYLITECLGLPAYKALMAVKGLSDDDLDGIVTRLRAVALPKAKTPTPNAERG